MFQLSPLGIVQTQPATKTNSGTLIAWGTTPETLYTCPAGYRASIVLLASQFLAFGTGTKGTIRINGVNVVGRTNITVADAAMVDSTSYQGVTLEAGQVIDVIGDAAGNNETLNYVVIVKETPT